MATQAARGMANDAAAARRFEVALSYPGEHRDYVGEVASHLAETFSQDRVLYDRYHDAEFARADLDIYLPGLYREQSELIVLFLCPEYAGKRWCRLEWRQIRQLIATVQAQRIMFLSFGDPGDLSALGILGGDGYIDLQALAPQAAAQKILTRLRVNRGGAQPAVPAGPTFRAAIKADISRIVRYAPADLIGREDELQLLDDAWAKAVGGQTKRPRVLSFVALGGEGKTSLVTKWAIELSGDNWPGCDAVFAWSFYSQGTREQTATSSELFLAEGLRFFGDADTAQSPASPVDKARRLAHLVGSQRSLLILDGLEPLQYAPTSPTPGELRDYGLAVLLKTLATNSLGLCLLTSRYSIADLRAFWPGSAPQHSLLRLSTPAGQALLRSLGIKGTPAEFDELVEKVKGHALSLNLLGTYLRDAHGGDIRQHSHVKLAEADAEEQGGHAFRIMDAYVLALRDDRGTGGETVSGGTGNGQRALALLRLMGLFDRPASADCLDALCAAPPIPGLTEQLTGLSDAQRNLALQRLRDAGLLSVVRDATGQLLALDCHPLIREYFARHLQRAAGSDTPATSTAWRGGHRRLYEHLCGHTREGNQPSLQDLQPLYQAIAHGCQAGLQQETCDRVYLQRIMRGQTAYSTKLLGAVGSDLGAVAWFFTTPWRQISTALTPAAQSWMLNEAAFSLRALGRLSEALDPMRVALRMDIELEDWKNAAVSAGNLSELTLALGETEGPDGALHAAEQAVAFADSSGDWFHRTSKRTTHGDTLHQMGRLRLALRLFEQAERTQIEHQGSGTTLYSGSGFRYCDLLLTSAERSAWRAALRCPSAGASAGQNLDDVSRRAETALLVVLNGSRNLLDIALNQLSLARALLYAALLQSTADTLGEAMNHTTNAIDGFHRASVQNRLPLGLLTRAWLRALQGRPTGPESAQTDLNEALEIAERGPMPLFQADIHLHRARLFYREASYPWQSAAHDLAEARRLIFKHGYLRRQQELEDAEAVILHGATSLPPLAEWQ